MTFLCRVLRHKRAKETIRVVEQLLSSVDSVTTDQNIVTRNQDPATSSKYLNLRQRSHTVRPATTYFPGDDDTDIALSGDHVISYPQPPTQTPTRTAGRSKTVKEKKKLGRSSTFKSKEKKEEKKEEKEKEKSASLSAQQGNHSAENNQRSEKLYVSCINALKVSLEEILVSVCIIQM